MILGTSGTRQVCLQRTELIDQRRKSLIPVLQLLIISYHMSRLMAVVTHKPSRARPSSITSWATISVMWIS